MTNKEVTYEAMRQAYLEAYAREDHLVCRQLQMEAIRLLSGKSLRIPIGESLGVDISWALR